LAKTNIAKGYFFASLYSKFVTGTIARIATTATGSTLIYNVFQNAGNSSSAGIEMVFSKQVASWYSVNLNANAYRNTIEAFTVKILYPETTQFSDERQQITSGNVKFNNLFTFSKSFTAQVLTTYLAPDIIPQGKVGSRFSLDIGLKRTIQKGNGEIFLNATDVFNTLVNKRSITAAGFNYTSKDYNETQVIRFGYNYKF